MLLVFLVIVVIGLAFANGANDNFKGVATLLGSGTTSYRTALLWGTGCTFLGSLAALGLSTKLLKTFSGKGIVPQETATNPGFLAAAVGGAALTVVLASRLGAPISTTHALLGGIVGSGVALAPAAVRWTQLSKVALLPLILSPLLSAAICGPLYLFFRWARLRVGIRKESCVCMDSTWVPTRMALVDGTMPRGPSIVAGSTSDCRNRYTGQLVGVEAQTILDGLHYLSCGAMSFARGLNDSPKIMAALAGLAVLSRESSLLFVALAMGVGGLVYARSVAETMSTGISEMNDGQGFSASLVTSGVVIAASIWGLPVSTTHVSVGSLVGMGAATRQAHWRRIGEVGLAWIVTLPLAAVLSGALSLAFAIA